MCYNLHVTTQTVTIQGEMIHYLKYIQIQFGSNFIINRSSDLRLIKHFTMTF